MEDKPLMVKRKRLRVPMWGKRDFGHGPLGRLSAMLLLLFFVLLAGGCQTQTTEDAQAPSTEGAATAPQRYVLFGKVVSLNEENKIAAIDHQEIVGWMGAMTMEFPVKEQSEWEKLHVGDQINAIVFVENAGFHLGEIVVVPASAGEGQAR